MVPRIVNIHEAKTHLSRLLEELQAAGGEIIIAKAGKPIARLLPLEEAGKRPLGFVKGRLTEAFFEPLPDSELRAWEESP